MRKLFIIVMCIGLLAFTLTAIASQPMSGMGAAAKSSADKSFEDMFEGPEDFMFIGAVMFLFAGIPFIIAACVCGTAARRKGLSGICFFILCFICTPIIGFLAVIAFPNKKQYLEAEIIEPDNAFCDSCNRRTIVDGECINCGYSPGNVSKDLRFK